MRVSSLIRLFAYCKMDIISGIYNYEIYIFHRKQQITLLFPLFSALKIYGVAVGLNYFTELV